MATEKMTGWKKKLAQAKDLRKQAAALIYDRVSLLVAVFDDPDFLADEGLDQLSAARRLDAEVADVCAGFLELKATLEFYPDRKQWIGRNLQLMVAEVMEAEDKAHAANHEPRKRAKRHTKAEFESLESERDRLKIQVADLKSENDAMREEIGAIKSDFSRLESHLSVDPVEA